jgi:predicted dienelactone hydrolase
MCAVGSGIPMCEQIRSGQQPAASTAVPADPRIKALVLVDPLPYYFSAKSVRSVNVPVQIWSSERGGDGLEPERVRQLARDLPTPADLKPVAKAGHFVFLAPCPPALEAE